MTAFFYILKRHSTIQYPIVAHSRASIDTQMVFMWTPVSKWNRNRRLVLSGRRFPFHFETGVRFYVDIGFNFIWKPVSSSMWTPVFISFGRLFAKKWIPVSNLFGWRYPKKLGTSVQIILDACLQKCFEMDNSVQKKSPRGSPAHDGPSSKILEEFSKGWRPAWKKYFTDAPQQHIAIMGTKIRLSPPLDNSCSEWYYTTWRSLFGEKPPN